MKYLSLFSGIGGFELGIQQAYENNFNRKYLQEQCRNWKSVQSNGDISNNQMSGTEGKSVCYVPQNIGYSEIDKYAIATYQSHFPEHKNYGDITKINEQELPDFDMLVGGFPCQAFSIAGKRKGFEDTRGTLFFDIARIIKAKQPRLVFLENVKGLLSHDNGETFRTIIATLDELGYDLQWQVLNSKNHGVPQNRERVFIIGHLRGTSRPEVFPFGGTDKETFNIIQLNNPKHSNDRVYGADGVSPTLNTMQGGNRQPFINRVNDALKEYTPTALDLENNALHKDRFMCLQEPHHNKHRLIENSKIRRLTPTECERLQGFPDNWTIGSDTQRYKQCGNAVTVNVIRDIAERFLTPPTKP